MKSTEQKINTLFGNFQRHTYHNSNYPTIHHPTLLTLSLNFSSFLIEKNKRYGDLALSPIQVFSKYPASTQISNRLDDKLSRIKNATSLNKNDLSDVFGYISLLLIQNNWIYFNYGKITIPKNSETPTLNIFSKSNPTPVLLQIDKRLSTIKNSTTITKNDIYDLFILIAISLMENNHTSFDELLD